MHARPARRQCHIPVCVLRWQLTIGLVLDYGFALENNPLDTAELPWAQVEAAARFALVQNRQLDGKPLARRNKHLQRSRSWLSGKSLEFRA